MDFYVLSDKAIESELGARLKALRLKNNMSQKELAEAATLSLNAIKSLESGRGKLATLIAVLRELGALEQLNSFIPQDTISPIELAKMQGRERKRATGTRSKNKPKDESKW